MGDTFEDWGHDENPVHTAELGGFYLSKYEVTFAEYDTFCTAIGRSKPEDEGWGRGQRPAINVSWYDAVEYANWLSKQNGFIPFYTINKSDNIYNNLKWIIVPNTGSNGYRLPTEAEWEYAARQGGQRIRFGNGKNIADPEVLNINGSALYKEKYSRIGAYKRETITVGSLDSPNQLGLHDMSGNVWDWCWDWYGRYYYENSPRNHPKGVELGEYRVVRGGSWATAAQSVRAANRHYSGPEYQGSDVGFRLARNAP